MDFLETLDEIEMPAEIVPARPAELSRTRDLRVERLKAMENDIFEESMATVRGTLRFAELGPDDKEEELPPWLDGLPKADALKVFRLAKAGSQSAKDAPVAVKIAAQMVTGALKARAMEKQGPRSLNVTFVKMAVTAEVRDEDYIEVAQ